MSTPGKWKEGVKVVRAASLDAQVRDPAGTGRATAFEFAGAGSGRTWVGRVRMKPAGVTGAHHHGRHEVMISVLTGHAEIRWGDHLEFAADVAPGDCIYFSPHVPHQERNPSATESVEFLVVRSDNERIVVALDAAIVERPEFVA